MWQVWCFWRGLDLTPKTLPLIQRLQVLSWGEEKRDRYGEKLILMAGKLSFMVANCPCACKAGWGFYFPFFYFNYPCKYCLLEKISISSDTQTTGVLQKKSWRLLLKIWLSDLPAYIDSPLPCCDGCLARWWHWCRMSLVAVTAVSPQRAGEAETLQYLFCNSAVLAPV